MRHLCSADTSKLTRLNMRFQRRERRGEPIPALAVSPQRFQESDRRGNGGKNRQSGRGGDASVELKFSLQSFHLFSWSHLSFSPLVSVTPTTHPPPARHRHPSPPPPPPPLPPRIQVSQFRRGHASCLRQSIGPHRENGLLSSSRVFSLGQLGSFAPNPEITFRGGRGGGGEKRQCIGAPPSRHRRRPPNWRRRWIFRSFRELIISGSCSDFGLSAHARVLPELPPRPGTGVKRSRSPLNQSEAGNAGFSR